MYHLSIVIPAYNEESKIAKDIEAVFEYFKKYSIKGELIIVDDGSKDGTFNIAESFKVKYPDLKIISYKQNRGKGYATRIGILQASGEYILFADSGLCVPFKFANLGLDYLKNGADIAIGSRRTPDNKAKILLQQPFYRRLGSRLFKLLIHSFGIIPKDIEDTQCGFKIFKKNVAHSIYVSCFTDRFMLDIEMLRRAKKAKYKIAIFPVEWSNDSDTRFNPFTGTFENILQMINIILRTCF